MKLVWKLALISLVAVVLGSTDADARRLGGGRHLGAQRATPTQVQKQAAPANAQPTPASMGNRWFGPVAGLLSGLGLGTLLAHGGLSGTFGFILAAVLGIALITLLVRRVTRNPDPVHGPLRYAGPAPGLHAPVGYETQPPPLPRAASAEPAVAPALESSAAAPRYPAGFDPEPFLRHARAAFVRIQAAFDAADYATLSDLLTPEMLSEARAEIIEHGHSRHPTEIVTLNAELIEVTAGGLLAWASVRFSGLLRESGAERVSPFDEVWDLQKPLAGPEGWRLAGIQQLSE